MADTLLKRLSVLLFMGRVLGGSFEVMVELPSPGGQQEGRLLSALAAPASNFSRAQPHDPAEELQTTTAGQMAAFGVVGAHRESPPAQGSAQFRGEVPPTCSGAAACPQGKATRPQCQQVVPQQDSIPV